MAELENKAELKYGVITAFEQGIGVYGVDDKHQNNTKEDHTASAPGYSRFIIKDPFIDDKRHYRSYEATQSLISNYLEKIVRQLDPEHGGNSVRFTTGADATKLPGGDKLYVSTPPHALIVEVTDAEKLQRLNRYLLDHKNEVARAIEDVQNKKVPEVPHVPARYQSAIDSQDTFAARREALTPEQRPIFDKQVELNVARHQAKQEQAQENDMQRTA